MRFSEMPLSHELAYIMEKLNAAGFRADIVGGAVRDYLLGVTPYDYDITSSATPEEMKSVFALDKIVETGIKHGTISLILNHKAYEVTTYRIDGDYLDSRHPESVFFTRDIERDLARRDFTVNAMAYNPHDGFTDIFGGVSDLEARIIRAVGDARARFTEDALRILRALRFASKLDFVIEEETERALFDCAHLLRNISRERIYAEWIKLLEGVGAYRVIEKYCEIIKIFIPELDKISLPERDKFNAASPEIRFISLFAQVGASAYESALISLRADTKSRECGKTLLENLSFPMGDKVQIKLAMAKIGAENTEKLLALRKALGKENEGEGEIYREILKNAEPYRISDLNINGNDLKAYCISGTEIGAALSLLQRAVIFGECENERDSLLAYLKIKKS